FLDFATLGSDELDISPLQDIVPDLALFDDTSAEQVLERIADTEVVFVNKVRLSREILESSPKIRFIGLTATGVDNVDIDAAVENGIAVCNIRGYCTQSVVEHVFAVLLNLSHNIGRYNRDVQNGEWQKASNFCMLNYPIRELSAMTIGIVGHGVLGSAVADMARQFGMNVRIARRQGEDPEAGDDRLDIREILQECDVLSLHCPLTDDNHGFIGAAEFQLMKPNAIFINTARGGLVDSAALVNALAKGRIAAAAIDVLSHEPPVDGDPLLDYRGENLIVTPHIAWATKQARQNAIKELAENLIAFSEGKQRNRIV
ncbi:MAG: glycerate dehydrogenase, partial [Woeseiaceae bacterium]